MGETEIELTPASVLQRRVEARARRYRGRMYVAVREQALELDEVAQAIVRRIDGTSTLRGIAAVVAEEYGVPAENATGDTVEFASQLLAHGVVEVVPGCSRSGPRVAPG
ncbi:PqqD family protein [Streptomyces sp. B27]|uniref:PqqD family protein n=1 Tax=Streptomyces sp. B27 TaxID=2485015 RepID=UPI000FD86CFF|nr:PqqD family protein [Streptomyces sp. B27]